jgi:hypothetical protein
MSELEDKGVTASSSYFRPVTGIDASIPVGLNERSEGRVFSRGFLEMVDRGPIEYLASQGFRRRLSTLGATQDKNG